MEFHTRPSSDGCSLRRGGQMVASIVVDPYITRYSRGGTSLVVGRAARRDTSQWLGNVPRGVMLLGATQSIAQSLEKVHLPRQVIVEKSGRAARGRNRAAPTRVARPLASVGCVAHTQNAVRPRVLGLLV